MASVIGTLVDGQIGADETRAVTTWVPSGQLRSGLRMARAAAGVLLLPDDATVHLHMSEGGSFIREAVVLAAARARGLSRVVTIHGQRFSAFADSHPRLVARVLGLATAITVLNEEHLAIVRRLVAGVPAEIVPNPIALDPEAGPASATDEIVLFAGEVGVRKGVDVLLEAWPLVRRARPRARLIVAGPPTELVLEPTDGLTVTGPVSPARISRYLREARLTVLPSRGEALPMILLEAMAAGRPFVSTPVGGIPTLADGGLLVPVGDAPATAAAIVTLLTDRERAASLGRAGQDLCQLSLSPVAVDRALRRLYRGESPGSHLAAGAATRSSAAPARRRRRRSTSR